MLRRTPMGSIQRTYDVTGIMDTDPIIFIQCSSGLGPMANKLWSHGLDGVCRNVHPTERVEIPTRTDREFITEYLTADGNCIEIIEKYYVNGSV